MSEGKRFSRESSIYVLGEFLSKALYFLLLPLYTSYLSIDDFAVLSVITMLWPVILILIGRGFVSYILRGYFEYRDGKRFFGTMILFSMITGAIAAVCIHLSGPWLFSHIFREISYRPYGQYAVFFAVFRLFFEEVLSLYRARRRAVASIVLSFILFVLNATAVLIAMFVFKTGLRGLLDAQVYCYILVTVVYIVFMRKEVDLRPVPEVIVPSIRYALPLVPHALSGWIITYISNIFIERNLPLSDLSVYSVALRLAMILSVISTGLNMAWSPFFYANAEKKDFKMLYTVNARKLLVFMVFLCGGLILFSRELLLLMQKKEYMAARNLLPMLALAYIFQLNYMTRVTMLFYRNKTALIPLISISSGIVAYGLNMALVPPLGMFGAAVSMLASFITLDILAHLLTRKYLHAHLLDAKVGLFIVCVGAVTALGFFLTGPLPLLPALGIKILACFLVYGTMHGLGLFRLIPFLKHFFTRSSGGTTLT